MPDPIAYPCKWCNKKPIRAETTGNLTIHWDGYLKNNRRRNACPGRAKAIARGAKLPPTAVELASTAVIPANQPAVTSFFDPKLPFKTHVFNQILVIWILAEALPWTRIEDHFLRVAFRYLKRDVKIFGRLWVAKEAEGMYVSLQDTVLKEIIVCLLSDYQLLMCQFKQQFDACLSLDVGFRGVRGSSP